MDPLGVDWNLDRLLRVVDDENVNERVIDLIGCRPLAVDETPGLLTADDPNSERVLQWLADDPPDLVVVFGGQILKAGWLTVPRLGALNVHYGWLPFFRGSASTQHALVHDRPELIGATVHYLDSGVDTGPIVRVVPVPVDASLSLGEVLARVHVAGIRALISAAAESLKCNRRLPATTQRAANSYFPSAWRSPTLDATARLRLRLLRTFPAVSGELERGLRPSRLRTAVERIKPVPRELDPGVYVFLYHSVPDPACASEWERAFAKVAVSLPNFRAHIEMLSRAFTPLPLSRISEVMRRGTADKPYAVITFDDGYRNLLDRVPEVLQRAGFQPTLFVNGAFAGGRIYYRVLASLLVHRGHASALRAMLSQRWPDVPWSDEPGRLFGQTKRHYVAGATESVIELAYARLVGDPTALNVHLGPREVADLQAKGWEIGNHTFSHRTLSSLTESEVADEIEQNSRYWSGHGVQLLDWISYPNGRAVDVGPATKAWMDAHPQFHGLMASGGVNLIPSRSEWLRIAVSDIDSRSVEDTIHRHRLMTKASIGRLTFGAVNVSRNRHMA